MGIPKWVQTGEQCVNYLDKEISKAQDHWELYGAAMATAYSEAYEDQAKLLDSVKKRIEAQKAADEKLMSFALSLLTVGVGGPVAGALVGRLVAKGGSVIAATKEDIEAAVKFAEKAGDW